MGATRQSLICEPLRPGVLPARSPGPFGVADAGDAGASMCMAGDTPGPVGTGGDAAAPADDAPAGFEVMLIDEGRVMGQIRRAAFLRASREEAGRDMGRHIAADTRFVQAVAADHRRRLVAQWVEAKRAGGDAALAFCRALAEANERDFAALMSAYGGYVAAGRDRARRIGYAGMVVSGVGFGATVIRKVASVFAGPIGWGIDVTTDVAIAGVDAAYAKQGKSPAQAEFEKLAEELLKKPVEEAAEKMPGAIERLYALAGKLGPELEKLDDLTRRLDDRLARIDALSKEPRVRSGAMKRATLGARKLRDLLVAQRAVVAPMRGAAAVARAGGSGGLKAARWAGRHGVGGLVGVAFIANDVAEAYARWQKELRTFSEP